MPEVLQATRGSDLLGTLLDESRQIETSEEKNDALLREIEFYEGLEKQLEVDIEGVKVELKNTQDKVHETQQELAQTAENAATIVKGLSLSRKYDPKRRASAGNAVNLYKAQKKLQARVQGREQFLNNRSAVGDIPSYHPNDFNTPPLVLKSK